MRTCLAIMVIISLILLGCVSAPIGGGEASVITTSKNFTMKEDGMDSFRLLEEGSTTTHTILMSKVESNAALLKIDTQSLLMHLGEARSITVGGKTVLVTLNSIDEGYARLTVSLSPQGGNGQPSGGGTQPNLKANGAQCASSSDCQSSHCSNGYCCASGSCCTSDSNCSVGKCNTTIYSCFTATLLSNGNPCSSNSNCQSNHCNNSYCCNTGKCCLSSSNCASGEVCNTTTASCVTSVHVYSAADAEQLANSTANGTLMSRFSSIFNSARQCVGGSALNKQCTPRIAVREEQVSPSTYRVIYSNSFNGTTCCASTDVLVMTVELSTNSTSSQWLDNTFTSNLANTMESGLSADCVTALQYMACRLS
ncbi:hypothetical protein H0N99_00650 [Candidatus Micrarchaeota archaeon]|nr:hypothetical protein [Candidatus Micrarchaeota archaeon]